MIMVRISWSKSLLGMKLGFTNTVLRQKRNPWPPTIKKFKTSTSSGKMMATVFWDMHGVLLLHISPPNATVNSAAHQSTLKKLKRAVQRKRSEMSDKRLLLLYDNARPHTAYATANLLERRGWEILEHPPYSPDLAPSEFHLFPNMKKYLRVKRFKSHNYVKHELQTWLRDQDPTFYRQGFENWISRLYKFLDREGDYEEK
jgi:transposase